MRSIIWFPAIDLELLSYFKVILACFTLQREQRKFSNLYFSILQALFYHYKCVVSFVDH